MKGKNIYCCPLKVILQALRQYENDLEAGTLGIDQHPPDCDDEVADFPAVFF